MTAAAEPAAFARRLRNRERLIGYWIACDNSIGTERLAGLGYDYLGVDGQHGVLSRDGWLRALGAIDSRHRAAGVLRVPAADPVVIGTALDLGARGVIVPMVTGAAEAEIAVKAWHVPRGTRSIGGPVRAELRVGSDPAEINAAVACIVMIETAGAVVELADICAIEGLDAIYVGPADLRIALGGRSPDDPSVEAQFTATLAEIRTAAERAGIGCGIHCLDGETAAKRLAEGFTFVTVSSDLTHLQEAAAAHLAAAAGR